MRNLSSKVVLCAALVMLGAAPARAFDLQSGIGFVAITNSVEDTEYVLRDALNQEVGRGLADRFGSLVFRDLVQGASYTVAETGGGTQPVTIRRFEEHPDQSFYDAHPPLVEGLNYIQTRDGTLLAAMVRAPLGQNLVPGRQYPTVIEYSGYAAADPNNPQPSTLLAQALGYATVGVNMRGSGCSGGIIDLFDLPTTADGYDIVETVAAQAWSYPKVGMIGISFPGISQIFVAGAQPPHLAAIAPFSVIGDIYRSPGFPGGIFNNGFAETWLQERADDAEPAPEGGQAWAIQRVNDGDTVCEANQKLRLQTLDPVDFTASEPYYTPALMDNRSPINWMSNIRVPMFLSGAWQDEQTGSGFVTLLRHLPKGRTTKVLLTNGVHSSPLEPEGLWTWIAFLDIYVGLKKPDPDRLALFAQAIYSQIWGPGHPTPPLPPDRYVQYNLPDEARAAFEREPRIRVLMENGAGSPDPGIPAPTFDLTFQKWPPPGMRATAWYFGPGGTLSLDRPDSEGFDSYNPDPELRPMQTIPGQGQSESWEIMPAYDWQPLPDGAAVAYATAPLAEDVTIVGQGAVDVFLRSSAVDTDIQVTLSEIRPDGNETYVQSGWLRASHRKLARKGQSKTEVVQTHLEADVEPMPSGQFVKMRVNLFASAHVFRAGSRIRISLEAPGGDRTRWAFETFDTDGLVTNDVARSRLMASRLVLPVIRRAEPPPGLPPCPGLRGQPCRTYEPASNGG